MRQAGVNPYVHFLSEGRREGRSPKSAGTWAPRSEVRAIVEASFDRDYYLSTYPDLANSVDPLEHFLDYGCREGRNPNADFSTQYYLEANGDVCGRAK